VKNRTLFVSLWVTSLLFVIAVLIVVMSDWDWGVRAGAIAVCAAVGVLFVLFMRRQPPETMAGAEPAAPQTVEEELLQAVNVMVVNRLKEIDTLMGGADEGLSALGEVDLRIRQARDFSIATAIADAPDMILDERALMTVALNRAWRISRFQRGTALQWDPNRELPAARIVATSGYGDRRPELETITIAPLEASTLRQGSVLAWKPDENLEGPLGMARSRIGVAITLGAFQWGWLLLEDDEERKLSTVEERFLAALGRETASALAAQKTWTDGRKSLDGLFKALGTHLDARRQFKEGRGIRIASLLKDAGIRLGIPGAELEAGIAAAYLMDLGEIAVPELVLNKEAELTPQERKFFERHPGLSAKLVREFLLVKPIEDIVACHHERFDGAGYPGRLSGEAIPRMARLLSVCDAFEAMLSRRTHREPMESSEALKTLDRHAGTQFDPEMVKAVRAAASEWLIRNRLY
jgi:HD-GYP domain-containing protein (c-di-GMP phosphodiesterase class II)